MTPVRLAVWLGFLLLVAVPARSSASCKSAAAKCVKDSQCCSGLVCEARECQSGCRINGAFYASGTLNPANACQSCQPTVSTTTFTNRVNGTACNDGFFCNGTDTCSGGSCDAHSGNPCRGPDGDEDCRESCNEAADNCTALDPPGSPCNDFNLCNGTDTCSFSGFCDLHAGVPAGTTCNDFIFCNGTDTCSGDSCSLHSGNPCPGPDGDSNCAESCNEAADNCTAPDPVGSACNDGLFCNGPDTCSGGSCALHSGNPCPGPDGDSNCAESCNEAADNCTAADPTGSACNDGLFCTGADTCNGGACVHSGDPCAGPDGDADCTESCNEAADNCTAADPTGSACNDGDVCTRTDTCQGGACVGERVGAVDNGDGTVSDCQTSLTWEKKGNNGGLHDLDNFYIWAGFCGDFSLCQPNAAAAAACTAGAVGSRGCALCASGSCDVEGFTTIWDWLVKVNAEGGNGFAGHNDWRIPDIHRDGGSTELETILAAQFPNCTSSPCVGPEFNNSCVEGCSVLTCSCTATSWYWSSVTFASFPDGARVVDFSNGDVDSYDVKYDTLFVRAVRGGP